MRLLDGQPIAGAPGCDLAGGVRFAIQFDGQLVPLRPGKTTIGSSPRCDLRIQQPGVHPLHCLIVNDGRELTVRKWAGEASVNDLPFDETPLTAGDRLCLGSTEVTVVDLDGGGASWSEMEQPVEYRPIEQSEPVESGWTGEPMPIATSADAAPTQPEQVPVPAAFITSTDGVELRAELEALRQQVADVEQKVTQCDVERVRWLETINRWSVRLDQWEESHSQRQQQFVDYENQTAECLQRAAELEQRVTELFASRTASTPKDTDETHPSRRAIEPAEQQPAATAGGKLFEDSAPISALEPEWNEPSQPAAVADEVPTPVASPTAYDWSSLWKAPPADAEQPESFDRRTTHDAESTEQDLAAASPIVETPHEGATEGPVTPDDAPASPWSESHSDSAVAGDEPSNTEVATNGQKNAEPESFIARYSHLFTEEGGQPGAAPTPAPQSPVVEPLRAQKPRNMGVVQRAANSQPASADGDEESVEQYMAKLLQRVRGDGPQTRASQAPPMPELLKTAPSVDKTAKPWTALGLESEAALGVLSAGDAKSPWVGNFAPGKHKPANSAPATDLEALRALANETARRAISTHALRKYRRTLVTKMIVSTLAGVTSLWLMLQSPDWRDLQFITACVSLMIAAYWAGETYRTLVESLRARAHDEPHDDVEDELAGFQSPLPIDVDRPRF